MWQVHPSTDLYGYCSSNNCPNWIQGLRDDLSIAKISIPGTNGSASYNGTGGDMFQTQSWDIEKQLSNGIRFLEARCRVRNEEIKVYEYSKRQAVNFQSDVIGKCAAFLQSYPREFIILMITDMEETNKSFSEILDNNCEPSNSCLLKKTTIPTVGEARGKIIILRKNFSGKYGISMNDLNDYATELYEPYVGTILKASCGESSDKWKSIKRRLTSIQENSREDNGSNKLCVTFTTGSGTFAYPYAVAGRLNVHLDKYLEEMTKRNEGPRSPQVYGCIVMDYPSVSLIRRIIDSNLSCQNQLS